MTAYWNRPVQEQAAATNAGAVSSETLVIETREGIERAETDLSAWVELSTDAVDTARALDKTTGSLPLRGISVGVKDLIDVAGLPTRAGSSITSPDPAPADAACVRRLRDLGAVIQGKTVTTEFGYFTPGKTRNPHGRNHTPGGSSSGSAAAVGAGTIPLALGTQTAGSLTRPASFCGAAGMVLAQGSTSLAGITGLSPTLDSLGLLARSVSDLEYAFASFTAVGRPVLRSQHVGHVFIWAGSDLDVLDPAMVRLISGLPTLLAAIAVDCEPLAWDAEVQMLANDHLTVMAYEAANTLTDVADHHAAALSAPLRSLLHEGHHTSDLARTTALGRRDRAREQLFARLGDSAVIVGPAALGPAPAGLSATGSPVLSRPWQLLGAPVVIVPGARDADGLPLGIQVIGQPGHEEGLFALAVALEKVLKSS